MQYNLSLKDLRFTNWLPFLKKLSALYSCEMIWACEHCSQSFFFFLLTSGNSSLSVNSRFLLYTETCKTGAKSILFGSRVSLGEDENDYSACPVTHLTFFSLILAFQLWLKTQGFFSCIFSCISCLLPWLGGSKRNCTLSAAEKHGVRFFVGCCTMP